jgi:hypothetical protein
MKRYNWHLLLASSLIALSASIYLLHFSIFRDAHHIFLYLIGDLAFLPVQVLLVTLIIEKLLNEREKRQMLKKLNMVIGVFFSEVGTSLLRSFSDFSPHSESIRKDLIVTNDWSNRSFSGMSRRLKSHDYRVEIQKERLEELKGFLLGKRDFLLGLLENPNLLEHESFTELLWAVFHLTEELSCRPRMTELTDPDCQHLNGDIKRVYASLVAEWLAYMRHLKDDYPYLFSLAVRTNPFDPAASPEIR